jgi:hypothetical protein
LEWLETLVNGIGNAMSSSLGSLWETISGSIWEVFIQWIYEAVYGAIADFFTLMGDMGIDLFALNWVQACLRLFSMFGWALFVAGLVVAIFDIAIEYQSMHQLNIKRQVMPILFGFLAVNLFTVVPVRLYTFCISTQNVLMHDLAGLFASEMSHMSLVDVAKQALTVMMGNVSVLSLLALIALGYCVVKIFFANIKRSGILMTQIAVGSLYMFSIPKGYTDGFIQWCKQVIALCVTAFLQMTLLYLGLLTWRNNMLLGLGVMLSANEVPRIAQTFGLDTSAKVNLSSAVYTTTSAVNLAKTIIKK